MGDVAIRPLSNQTVIALPRGGPPVVVPAMAAHALTTCSRFRSLDEHKVHIGAAMRLPPERASHVIDELLAAGLLLSEPDLFAGCARSTSSPVSIETVCILTRDRPQALDDALASYLAQCRRHGRSPEFAVFDDSTSSAVRDEARTRLTKLARDQGVAISYAGVEEKQNARDLLAATSGVAPELLAFALGNPEGFASSTGANRNAVLLHTAGRAFFSADDDTLCRPGVTKDAAPGFALVGEIDPTELHFFDRREDALGSVRFVDEDVLAAHEQLLGRGVGSLLATAAGPYDLDRMCGHALRALQSETASVAVTFSGLVGDSGMYSPGWLLTCDSSATFARLTESEAAYQRALSSREISRAVTRTTVAHGGVCMGAFFAADNRQLLPPFFPVLRNQDGVFGTTLAVSGDAYAGYLPHVLPHNAASRTYSPGYMVAVSVVRMSDIVMAILSMVGASLPRLPDRASTFRALGERIQELGRLNEEDFHEAVRSALFRVAAPVMTRMESQLARPGLPPFIARDLAKRMSLLSASVCGEDYPIPSDLPQGGDRSALRAMTRRLVLQHGHLLARWAEIVQAAAELHGSGRPVARPLAD
ncbi:MAG: hypothetical protein H0T42_24895 [Deltaproteobacteria bacterium]|nr:hypothetical protein [Deltaproteobacteria bacterium]